MSIYYGGLMTSLLPLIMGLALDSSLTFQCFNYGDKVQYGFVSCVNSNYQSVSRDLSFSLPSCYNFGDDVSYSFTSCVNNNFSRISVETGIYLPTCFNFGPKVQYSFVSCINSNFSRLNSF